MTGMEHAISMVARVIADHVGFLEDLDSDPQSVQDVYLHPVALARALDQAGLLAPSPLAEEWAARYVNGGGSVCRTRREAEADLGRMIRDSQRPRIDDPPAPPVAGIHVRYVTAWEPADGIDRSEGGKAATSD